MRIIVIGNQKGGVGKTTTTVNFAASLALLGMRVLVVDCEPQAQAGECLGVPVLSVDPARSVGRFMVDKTMGISPTREALLAALYDVQAATEPRDSKTRFQNVGALRLLAGEQRTLLAADRGIKAMGHDGLTVLRELLMLLENEFDYAVVDSPPSVDVLAQTAVAAGDDVIAACTPYFMSFAGVGAIRNLTVSMAGITQGRCRPQFLGTLQIRTSAPSERSMEETTVRDSLARGLEGSDKHVYLYPFMAEIRKDDRVSAASALGVPAVVQYQNYAPGKQFIKFTSEYIDRVATSPDTWEVPEAFEIPMQAESPEETADV